MARRLFIFTLLVMSAVVLCAAAQLNPRDVVTGLGYECSPLIEKKTVTVPETLDAVWENYNEIQKEGGYNLESYRGKDVTVYTYAVSNHPFGEVYAHVMVCGGRVIGGDISSVAVDGFMQPLG